MDTNALDRLPPYLTPAEVAHLLRTSIRTVWRWLLRGRLASVRPSRRWLIPREAVVALLAEPPATATAPSPKPKLRKGTTRRAALKAWAEAKLREQGV